MNYKHKHVILTINYYQSKVKKPNKTPMYVKRFALIECIMNFIDFQIRQHEIKGLDGYVSFGAKTVRNYKRVAKKP